MQQLPQEFIDMLNGYGFEGFDGLADTLQNTEPAVSVRINPDKAYFAPDTENVAAISWCPLGRYLDTRPAFAFDPAWHSGDYYVQDASSMALGAVVEHLIQTYFTDSADGPVRQGVYLDACAAPGGKTIAALDALPRSWFAVANEYDFRRANILAENLAKRGLMNHAVSRGDTSRLSRLHSMFDIVAADVPCSGEGMMRKDEQAVAQWSAALVTECAARQREIVANLWPALKPGGFLIYSTCTFNRLENEDNIEYFAEEYGAEGIALPADRFPGADAGIACALPCLRFTPGRVRGEGLFLCVLRKPADDNTGARRSKKKSREGRNAEQPDAAIARFAHEHLLLQSDEYELINNADGTVSFIPADRLSLAKEISIALDLICCGTPFAEMKGKYPVPCHALSQSVHLRENSFPEIPLDYAGAMRYLHGDALTDLPDGLPQGFVTATHEGSVLGFAKNIGRRANNLYPSALRLRSAAPDTAAPALTINKSHHRQQ